MFTLDITKFRSLFVTYSNATTCPDDLITMNWDTATLYISSEDYGWLDGAQRERCLYLMTAHLTALADMIATGQTPSMVSGSSIDKVSVTLTPPPVKNQFHWWLSTTAYGAQLLALLKIAAVGGMHVGGNAERSAFRKVGGSF